MKIVYFSYLYDLNGISLGAKIKAEELLSELRNQGHEVKIFWLNKQPAQSSNNLPGKLRKTTKVLLSKYLHEASQLLANFKYLVKESRIVKAESPDVVITRLDTYLCSSLLVSKWKKIPLIVELDNPVAYEFETFETFYKKNIGILKFFERLNLKYAHRIFTVTEELKDFYVGQRISADKIDVICNGADIERFNPQVKKDSVVKKYKLQNTVVVGFVGTFHYWHGIENLKAVLLKVLSLGENIRFLMVGSGGPMKEQLQEFIERNQLQDRAILTGYVSHEKIPNYISAMDLVLAPYPNLRFFYYSPIKIFEYMASGKPVVTTRIGQIARIINDGDNGCLCEPDEISDMVEKISTLIKDAKLRELIGGKARKSIETNHSWSYKAKQLSQLCKQVVNGAA